MEILLYMVMGYFCIGWLFGGVIAYLCKRFGLRPDMKDNELIELALMMPVYFLVVIFSKKVRDIAFGKDEEI